MMASVGPLLILALLAQAPTESWLNVSSRLSVGNPRMRRAGATAH